MGDPPAGLFSGLVSHVVSAKLRYPRLVTQLASSANIVNKSDTWAAAVAASSGSARAAAVKAVPDIWPSLGASGAIYGAVTLTALAFPESQVALFIPPSYPISIQWGVGGMLLLDTIGILRGWRYVGAFLSLAFTDGVGETGSSIIGPILGVLHSALHIMRTVLRFGSVRDGHFKQPPRQKRSIV